MPDNPAGTVAAVMIIAVVTLVAISVLGVFGGVASSLGTTSGDVSYNPTVNETETLDHDVEEAPSFFEIKLTKGHGITLGGEGHVAANAPSDWPGAGNWTTCATGRLKEGFNDQAAYTLLAVENETVTLHYDDGVWAGYHEREDGNASRVTLPANEPTTWTTLCLKHENDTESLLLYRDGEKSGIGNYGDAKRPMGNDWIGDVDEVRFFDIDLDDAEAQTYADAPAAGLGVEDVARWMFEEGSGGTTDAFFMDATATLEGDAQWGDGVDDPGLVEGEDYERGVDPLDVTPIAGGLIDASPILYVSWATGLGGHFATVMSGISSALQLVPILLLVMIASLIVAATARLRE